MTARRPRRARRAPLAKANPVADGGVTPPGKNGKNSDNSIVIGEGPKDFSHPSLRERMEDAILEHSSFDGPKRMMIEDCDGKTYLFVVPEAGEC